MKRVARTCAVFAALLCASCVKKPVTAPRAVVPETVSSELRIAASQGKDFGKYSQK